MALYDNQHWLLSHVRHSYISSDDTGFSEMVMLGEDLRLSTMESFPGVGDDEEEEEGDLLSQSFDIQSDLDFGAHRQRSNTAQRLEKMDRERRKASRIKHIKWENPQTSSDDKSDLFEKKILKPKQAGKNKNRTSVLSAQLKSCPYMPQNPFLEYSKHDGSAQVGVSVRRYAIFLTMLPPSERDYPLHITVVSTATVLELIGLVLFRCSVERGQQKLPEEVSLYSLHIAEDDGEVDWDFPCLDTHETVAKFGFSYLALVQRAAGQAAHPGSQTMSLPTSQKNGPSLAERDEIEIGGAVDQAMKLQAQQEAEQRMKGHMTAMEAPLYQSYQVYIINRVRARSAIHLGISGDKVEIDPVVPQKPSSRFWVRRRASTFDMSSVAACELANNKHSSKAGFRLVYQPSAEDSNSTFKALDFEAEIAVAQEIVQKINHILELHSGIVRREYLASKERKSQRRKSFSLVLR